MASETIADILREMLALGRFNEKSTDKIPRSFHALELRTYADRIKAAHKREVVTDCKRSKMREALKGIRDWLVVHNAYVDTEREIAKLNAALAEPPFKDCPKLGIEQGKIGGSNTEARPIQRESEVEDGK